MTALAIAVSFLFGAVLMLGWRLRQLRQVTESNSKRFAECINELSQRSGGDDMLREKQ